MTTQDCTQDDVTCAIPVFNGERDVAGAIQSVLAQNPTPDLVVYDNCSTDSTVEICVRNLSPNHIRTSPTNIGASANFNRALEGATSEFFMWLAADDRLGHAEFTRRCVRALRENPACDAALPTVVLIGANGRRSHIQIDHRLASTRERIRLRAFLRRRRWTEVYCMYRREALMRSPGFLPRYGADVILSWWFLLRKPFVVVPDAYLEYRAAELKTASQMTQALIPGTSNHRWPKIKLWKALWTLTRDPDLPARTRIGAKVELIAVCFTKFGLRHLREDFRSRFA